MAGKTNDLFQYLIDNLPTWLNGNQGDPVT